MPSNKKVITSKKILQEIFKSQGIATILVFLFIFILLSISSEHFLTLSNITALMRQISMMLIAGVGMSYLIIAGGIDLSIGSSLAVTGVVAGLLVAKAGLPVPIAMILGILLGGLIGLINGVLVTKVYIPPLLATLGTMTALRGLAFLITGGHTIRGLPESYQYLGRGTIFNYMPVSVFISLLVFFIFWYIQRKTKFGLYMYVIGGNKIAARYLGINDKLYMNYAFIMSGLLTGVAGVMSSSRIGAALPNLGVGFELDVITGVVIGGTSIFGGIGRLQGTLLGILIIGMITNGMLLLDIHSYWQQVAKGLILLIAVGAETLKQSRKK